MGKYHDWVRGEVLKRRIAPILEAEAKEADTAKVKENARRVATRLAQDGAIPENIVAQVGRAYGQTGRDEAQRVIRERRS